MAKKKTPKKEAKKRGPKRGGKSPATAEGRAKAGASAASHSKQINDTGLTDQQLRFVQEYVVHLNATKAAKLAGYSETSAGSIGTQLLSHERIREVLAEKLEARSRRLDVTGDRVLQEVAAMAYANMDDVATWKNERIFLKDSADLSRIHKASIKSLNPKFDREGNPLGVYVTLHDKPRAAELLMRHLGMLDPTGRQDTQGTIVEFMKGLRNGRGNE